MSSALTLSVIVKLLEDKLPTETSVSTKRNIVKKKLDDAGVPSEMQKTGVRNQTNYPPTLKLKEFIQNFETVVGKYSLRKVTGMGDISWDNDGDDKEPKTKPVLVGNIFTGEDAEGKVVSPWIQKFMENRDTKSRLPTLLIVGYRTISQETIFQELEDSLLYTINYMSMAKYLEDSTVGGDYSVVIMTQCIAKGYGDKLPAEVVYLNEQYVNCRLATSVEKTKKTIEWLITRAQTVRSVWERNVGSYA